MTIVRFFNQTVGNIDHLLWNFGDGTTSSSMNSTVDHRYETGGDYTVSLQAWSVSGQTGIQTKIVSIPKAAPAPEILYIAGGEGNNIYVSSDGINWTTKEINSEIGYIRYITYINNLWFILGTKTNTKGAVFKSSDGLTWIDVSPETPLDSDFYSITFFEELYIIVGDTGYNSFYPSPLLFTSSDLNIWAQRNPDTDCSVLNTIESNESLTIASGYTVEFFY